MASILPSLLLVATCAAPADSGPLPITESLIHLGDTKKPEWKDFTTVDPVHPTRKEIEFESKENKQELVLEVNAGGVATDWKVRINGSEVGALEKKEPLTQQFFPVPAFTLRNGRNWFLVVSERGGDDVFVGKAFLHDRPLSELRGYARVRVQVRDGDCGKPLPCRLTIAKRVEKKEKRKEKDKDGKEREVERTTYADELMKLSDVKGEDLATRDGIVYTKNGAGEFQIPAGDYVIYATHGFEYGLAESRIHLSRLEEKSIELEIRREVDTTGLLAADTHVHTKTYSGHGDINLEERMVAILGEGVEIAVATDHNHNTDYEPTMKKVGVDGEFTSIVGNEVTTEWAHFGAFPFKKGAEPPDHDHSDWMKLVQAMRAGAGVRVVILNHPQRALGKQSPFEQIRLNPLTGEAHRGPEDLGIDAIEVSNGKTLTSDRMQALNDWFGLLNRGYRMKAVAASDSHAVNEVVGQARTYVMSSTDDPRKIQIDEICDNFLAGKLLPSLGLLTNVVVNGKYRVGDIVTDAVSDLDVDITVQGPSWTRADLVVLYLNGVEVKREAIPKEDGKRCPIKFHATWRIPTPEYDAYLVAVASGPAVTEVYWPIQGGDKKYVMGLTNPVWIDADGDGKFTSAFGYAAAILNAHGLTGDAVRAELEKHDTPVSCQFASLARAKIQHDAQEAYDRLMADADTKLADLLAVKDAKVKKSFSDYVAAAPKVEVKTRQERTDESARLKKEEEDRKKRHDEAEKKKREEDEKKRKEEEEKKKSAGRKGRI